MKQLLIIIVLFLCGPLHAEGLLEDLTGLVKKSFPDAKVNSGEGTLMIRHATRTFMVHGRSMTGEIAKEAHEEIGPSYKGFILQVGLQKDDYDVQAALPQTLRGPYWETYIHRIKAAEGEGHYYISFAFGSRLDKKFKEAVQALLEERAKG